MKKPLDTRPARRAARIAAVETVNRKMSALPAKAEAFARLLEEERALRLKLAAVTDAQHEIASEYRGSFENRFVASVENALTARGVRGWYMSSFEAREADRTETTLVASIEVA